MPKKDENQEEIEKQLRLIEKLATRLPWIAVIAVFISMMAILIELYFFH